MIVECPKGILIPLIIVLSAVGTYAIQNNPVHVYWMLLFGVIGYFMKMYGFQVGPVILGVILGPMIDSNYRRAMIGARGDVGLFFWNFISHPITFVLFTAFLLMLLSQTPLPRAIRGWRSRHTRSNKHHPE
jgi:putative tricarboxylic transport membrane protein